MAPVQWLFELVSAIVLEHLEIQDLIVLDCTGICRNNPILRLIFDAVLRRIARSAGAVCYATGNSTWEGDSPRRDVLHWLRNRRGFAPRPRDFADSFELLQGVAAPSSALTQVGEGFDSRQAGRAQELPREEQPVLPLAYGVRKGWGLYVEFRLAWEERGNGEACQLGVLRRSKESPMGGRECLLKFSPSAGAVFKFRPDGCLRAWPLEDLWVENFPDKHMALDVGVHVSKCGQVSFFRRGPFDSKARNFEEYSWETAGCFDVRDGFNDDETAPHEFHVFLSLVDRHTPLHVDLARVVDHPPVAPPQVLQTLDWKWRPG